MINRSHVVGFLVCSNILTYISAVIIAARLNQEMLRYKKLNEATEYMIHILEEHGVDLSEFDWIALNDLAEDINK